MIIFICISSLIVAAILIAAAAINLLVALAAKGRIHERVQDAPPAQVAIALGARVFPDGTMPGMTEDRVTTAVQLYQAGKVKKLLFSGDHGRRGYDEVNAMRRAAREMGVPAEDIFLDHAGFSTYESMCRAQSVFGIERAILVTQEFHLPRAIYLARRKGIDAVGVVADQRVYRALWRNIAREYAASCKDFVRVIINAAPIYGGKPIPISGDGRASWDEKE